EIKELRNPRVRQLVDGGRALAAGLDEPLSAQRGQVLRGRSGVEIEKRLKVAGAALVRLEKVEDAQTHRMGEDPVEICLYVSGVGHRRSRLCIRTLECNLKDL